MITGQNIFFLGLVPSRGASVLLMEPLSKYLVNDATQCATVGKFCEELAKFKQWNFRLNPPCLELAGKPAVTQ